MDLLVIALLLIVAIVSAMYLGVLLSDKLPEFDSLFDRKPFNCRPCLTFHIAWIEAAVIAIATASPLLFVVGVGVAFIVFAIVKYIDNQKIEK